MKSMIRPLIALAVLCALPVIAPAYAQHDEEGAGHSHDRAESHGGSATMTKEFHFETVFHSDAVMIYVYDGSQGPLDAKGVTGTVDLEFRDRGRQPLHAKLEYVPAESGEVGYLRAALDLSEIAEAEAKAKVDLHGLAGGSEKEVSFRETFRLAEEAGHDGHGEGHEHGEMKDDDHHGH